ncbi:MAG: transglutaminase-like domain-containing protein [Phycisphaerales bacterium]
MSDHNLTRRDAILTGSAAALAVMAAAGAQASLLQPYGNKDKDKDKKKQDAKAPKEPDLARLLLPGTRHDWTLKVDIDVNAYVERDSKNMPVVHDFKFDSAVVVFPVLKGTSSSRSYPTELKSKLSFNDVLIANVPSGYSEAYPCGTRLGKWEMSEKTGREVRLEIDIPMTCWQTKFDEKAAEGVPWPNRWPAVPMSTFNDRQAVGRNREGDEVVLIEHDAPIVQELLKKWTNDKDPKSIPPVVLAKYLAGQILEYIQPSGNGLWFNKNSGLEGFNLVGARTALEKRRGTEHDVACALAAIYRAAGLPARLVIGYDISDEKGKDSNFLAKKPSSVPEFRTWVEFALFLDSAAKEIWVPVDVNRQRKASSRNTSNWRYFGSNDELENVLPIAHQFHPPTFVMAHGSPCFWGWVVRPEAQVATQFLRFDAITTPKTSNSKRDREKD